MADRADGGRRARLHKLWPVWLIYMALFALVALGRVAALVSDDVYLAWFTFFLAPFSAIYCVPFGLGVGILAQSRVWYMPHYAHRLIRFCAFLMLAAMVVAWCSRLVGNFDPMYVVACLWPTLISALFMQFGMYLVRQNEYEASLEDSDDIYSRPKKKRRQR